MSVKVYCVRHETNHNLTITELLELIHIYQYNMAHYAYDEPLPVAKHSNSVVVLTKALCPLHDLGTIDTEKQPMSKVRSYVEHMLYKRGIRVRKTA